MLAAVVTTHAKQRGGKKKPTLRPEHVLETVNRWRQLPRDFYIASGLDPEKDRMTAYLARLNASSWNDDRWEQSHIEPGMAICKIELQAAVEPFRLSVITRPLVIFSQHAVARCFQRLGTDNAMVVFHHMAATVAPTAQWRQGEIVVRSGRWIGTTQEVRVNEHVVKVRAIRSFLGDLGGSVRPQPATDALASEFAVS
jgi:hypothetical protein